MTEINRSRHTSALWLAAAFICLIGLLDPPPTDAAAARLASFHGCGDIPSLTTWDIRAKRVGCAKAKKVARAYVAAVGGNGGPTQDVLGFHCKISGYYGDGAYYRCAAEGHRIVRFTRGG